MKMKEIIAIAKKLDVPYKVGISKEELIRAIQKKEGYEDCFRRGIVDCNQMECLWRADCFSKK